MVLSAILGLEVLCWEARIAVAFPDAIGEEPLLQGHLDCSSVTALASASETFTAASEHGRYCWTDD